MHLKLKHSRLLTGPLAIFDLILGLTTAFAPQYYLNLIHGQSFGEMFMLKRTAVLWLFFAAVETWTFLNPKPALIFLVAALRLMEVPADIIYFLTSLSLTNFGKFSLIFASFFNLGAGGFLIRLYRKLIVS